MADTEYTPDNYESSKIIIGAIIKIPKMLRFVPNPVNSIQELGVWDKKTPTSFYPVPCTNVKVSPQNLLTFSFNHFATLV